MEVPYNRLTLTRERNKMNFTLNIDCDNAAFEEDSSAEVARILRTLADKLDNGQTYFPNVFDLNGNGVGLAQFNDRS
jgi:hypothetical protein